MSQTLAACAGNTVKFWDLPQQAATASFEPHKGNTIGAVCWNHNNQVLASACHNGSIGLSHASGKVLGRLEHPDKEQPTALFSVAFSHDSKFLASAGSDAMVRVWDMKRRNVANTYKGHRAPISWVDFNWDATLLASSSLKGDILVHQVAKPSVSQILPTTEATGVHAVRFSPFYKSWAAAAGDSGAVSVWDVNTSKSLWRLAEAHLAPCIGVAFSAANKLLMVSAGHDRQLVFYDVQDQRKMNSISTEAPPQSLAFMDDGVSVAVGTNDGSVYIYDLRNAGSRPKFSLFREFAGAVTGLAFQTKAAAPKRATAPGVPSQAALRSKATTAHRKAMLNSAVAAASQPSRTRPSPVPAPIATRSASSAPAFAKPSPGMTKATPSATSTPSKTPGRDAARTAPPAVGDIFSPIKPVGPPRTEAVGKFDGNNYGSGGQPRTKIALDRGVFTPEPSPAQAQVPAPVVQMPQSAVTAPVFTPENSPAVVKTHSATPIDRPPQQPASRSPKSTAAASPAPNLLRDPTPTTPFGATSPISKNILRQESPYTTLGRTSAPASGAAAARPPSRELYAARHVPDDLEKPGGNKRPRKNSSPAIPPGPLATSRPRQPVASTNLGAPKVSGLVGAGSSFQADFVKNLLDATLEDFRFALHRDVHNMHLELLRQFEMQKTELRQMVESASVNSDLVAEIQRLRLENEQLRQAY